MLASEAVRAGTKWPSVGVVRPWVAGPPSTRRAVRFPPRSTTSWPVWQAAQVTSRTASPSSGSKRFAKPTGSWSGFAAVGSGSTMKP